MSVILDIRSESAHKRCHRASDLRRIAERVCTGEGVTGDAELSVLLCDDPRIRELNRTYRKKDVATDVLSFAQDTVEGAQGPRILGDIVISLDTVHRNCAERLGHAPDLGCVRNEVCLLFCHGLLHLLGHDHPNAASRKAMTAKQAAYLGIEPESAWHNAPPRPGAC
ncbi:MAG: putative rRNA maturation factor [Candidatus Hydrogenedentes bacterium]|nr:putative rRNA maturation factor [Candidatus Hydrogenedentota bacterium]